MPDSELEIEALTARVARAERIACIAGGIAVLLFLGMFGILIGQGGDLARIKVRVPDSLPVVVKAAPVLPPEPAPPSTKLEATSFVLRDSKGKDRISMGVLPDDSTFIGVQNSVGFPQLMFLGRSKGAALSMANGSGPAIRMSVDQQTQSIIVEGQQGTSIGHLP